MEQPLSIGGYRARHVRTRDGSHGAIRSGRSRHDEHPSASVSMTWTPAGRAYEQSALIVGESDIHGGGHLIDHCRV